jgi:hypothetical protein
MYNKLLHLTMGLSLVFISAGFAQEPTLVPLKTGIEFSEKMPPLDPVLWTGNYFDKEAATALLKQRSSTTKAGCHIWRKIPKWMAGTWESTQSTETRSVHYKDGQPASEENPMGVYTAKAAETIGWQKDRNGDIWEEYDSDYWTEVDYGDYIGYQFITVSSPGVADYPDIYTESVNFAVDKATNKILHAAPYRAWGKHTFVAPEIMKEQEVHTTYDEHGLPESTAWNTTLHRRIEPFVVFRDSYKDFVTYLNNNGLADLIPLTKHTRIAKNATGKAPR